MILVGHRSYLRLVTHACVVCLCLTAIKMRAEAAETETLAIEGALTKGFTENSVLRYSLPMPFALAVESNAYYLSLTELEPNSPVYQYVICDGMDTFQLQMLLQFDREKYLNGSGTAILNRQPYAIAQIEDGNFPAHASMSVQILWLAAHLRTAKLHANQVLPFTAFTKDPMCELSSLRQQVYLGMDGVLAGFDVFAPQKGFDKQAQYKYKLPDAYSNGYLLASCRIKGNTNIDEGLTRIKEIEFTLNYPKVDNATSTEDVLAWNTWRFEVTNNTRVVRANFVTNPVLMPYQPFEGTGIEDDRFAAMGGGHTPINYMLSKDEPVSFRASSRYKNALAEAHSTENQANRGRLTFWLVLIFSLGTFGILLFYVKQRTARN